MNEDSSANIKSNKQQHDKRKAYDKIVKRAREIEAEINKQVK